MAIASMLCEPEAALADAVKHDVCEVNVEVRQDRNGEGYRRRNPSRSDR